MASVEKATRILILVGSSVVSVIRSIVRWSNKVDLADKNAPGNSVVKKRETKTNNPRIGVVKDGKEIGHSDRSTVYKPLMGLLVS